MNVLTKIALYLKGPLDKTFGLSNFSMVHNFKKIGTPKEKKSCKVEGFCKVSCPTGCAILCKQKYEAVVRRPALTQWIT